MHHCMCARTHTLKSDIEALTFIISVLSRKRQENHYKFEAGLTTHTVRPCLKNNNNKNYLKSNIYETRNRVQRDENIPWSQ